MLPMKAVRIRLGELLAADATTLAPATDANIIALIAAPFTESENLTVAGLTLATFTGSAPIEGATGSQQSGVKPATGEQAVTILAPAGGWRWECTAAPTTPEGIFGYCLLSNDGLTILAVTTLPTPQSIAGVGDFIDLGAVELTFTLAPIS